MSWTFFLAWSARPLWNNRYFWNLGLINKTLPDIFRAYFRFVTNKMWKAYLTLWSLCHHCRMVVLETRQTDDQLGLSNLYILEVAVNYVMLPWPVCLVELRSSPESTSGWIPCLGTRSGCHWGTIASYFLVGDAETCLDVANLHCPLRILVL